MGEEGATSGPSVSPSAQRAAARRRQRQRQAQQRPRAGAAGIRWDRGRSHRSAGHARHRPAALHSPLTAGYAAHVAAQQETDLKSLEAQNRQLHSDIKTLHTPVSDRDRGSQARDVKRVERPTCGEPAQELNSLASFGCRIRRRERASKMRWGHEREYVEIAHAEIRSPGTQVRRQVFYRSRT